MSTVVTKLAQAEERLAHVGKRNKEIVKVNKVWLKGVEKS
jgi:hypothetical protein